jgi:hypothetical protein
MIVLLVQYPDFARAGMTCRFASFTFVDPCSYDSPARAEIPVKKSNIVLPRVHVTIGYIHAADLISRPACEIQRAGSAVVAAAL